MRTWIDMIPTNDNRQGGRVQVYELAYWYPTEYGEGARSLRGEALMLSVATLFKSMQRMGASAHRNVNSDLNGAVCDFFVNIVFSVLSKIHKLEFIYLRAI